MVVTPNDYRSVATMPVPVAIEPTITSVELGARTAIVSTVAIVIPVASDAEAETLCAGDCRRCNRDGR
jgi:hypothetical protein